MENINKNMVSPAFVQRRYAWPKAGMPDHLVVDELLPDGNFREIVVECSGGLYSGESLEVEHLPFHTRRGDGEHELVILHTPTHDWQAEVLASEEGKHIHERVIEGLAFLLTPRVEPIPYED